MYNQGLHRLKLVTGVDISTRLVNKSGRAGKNTIRSRRTAAAALKSAVFRLSISIVLINISEASKCKIESVILNHGRELFHLHRLYPAMSFIVLNFAMIRARRWDVWGQSHKFLLCLALGIFSRFIWKLSVMDSNLLSYYLIRSEINYSNK